MNDSTYRDVTPKVIAACADFVRGQRSLMLASIGDDGVPCASYAPFTLDTNGQPLIYISNLSTHTDNLRRRPSTSVLIIDHQSLADISGDQHPSEDEQAVFAPRRLSMNCDAVFVARENDQYAECIQRLRVTLGAMMDVLITLPDFNLVRLQATNGTFIQGFARAHNLEEQQLVAALTTAAL